MNSIWPRRTWLTQQAVMLAATHASLRSRRGPSRHPTNDSPARVASLAAQVMHLDPAPWQALAQQAIDAARTAGARYADARLTRTLQHEYTLNLMRSEMGDFSGSYERVGIGVRALVDGYWGFSASPDVAPDEVVRLARDAVAQARENAKGPPRAVDLGHIPVATGTWMTPVSIDPFTISIEEKLDHMAYWRQCFDYAGLDTGVAWIEDWLRFVRQEQVVATSEGALFTQTRYESGGHITCAPVYVRGKRQATTQIPGIEMAGAGWERLRDSQIVGVIPLILEDLAQRAAIRSKNSTVGRYALVCDGATMAALLGETLGVATQLDRALGYEANAGGTSFIDDPLAMVGHLAVATPLVTVTANRSVPGELATVKWDDEGVEPQPFTLVKDGVLTDFQTTREQAAWLAPYYQSRGRPVTSHGCAASQDAHVITIQQMPNLALEPSVSTIKIEDMVADVQDGLFIEGGTVGMRDFQERTLQLDADRMRQIKNGRLGEEVLGGVVFIDVQDFWKRIQTVGGASTQAIVSNTQFVERRRNHFLNDLYRWIRNNKSEPLQDTSHSVRAAAATVPNQPLIIPRATI